MAARISIATTSRLRLRSQKVPTTSSSMLQFRRARPTCSRSSFWACIRMHAQKLLLEQVGLARRNCSIEDEVVGTFCERNLKREVVAIEILAAITHRVHTGIELLHSRKQLLQALFILLIVGRIGKCDLKELHIKRLKQRAVLLEPRDLVGTYQVLHEEPMKIVIQMRII